MATRKAYELTLQKKRNTGFDSVKLTNPKEMADYARQFYFDDLTIYESVFIILMNNNCKVIGYAKISQGGITMAPVDFRLICKYALDSLATRLVIVHNHPSGNLRPSKDDDTFTFKTKSSLDMFDIKLLDSIILSDDDYYSYLDNEKL
jgi:DNA repair protein RadC